MSNNSFACSVKKYPIYSSLNLAPGICLWWSGWKMTTLVLTKVHSFITRSCKTTCAYNSHWDSSKKNRRFCRISAWNLFLLTEWPKQSSFRSNFLRKKAMYLHCVSIVQSPLCNFCPCWPILASLSEVKQSQKQLNIYNMKEHFGIIWN